MPALAGGAERSSADYLSFLPADVRETLYSSGEVSTIAARIDRLPLWQNSPFAAGIRDSLEGFDSSIAAEGLFLIERPDVAPEELNPRIFNSFTAFSTLKGLQAFSVSRQRMETFLYDASLVDPADRRRRLPDTTVTSVPPRAEYTVYEKEEQTGDSYAKFSFVYDAANDSFDVSVTNLTAMHWLVFTLADPGNVRTYFHVVPCRDRLILYGLTSVKTYRLLGLERTKEKSFYNRMRALVSWFTDNVGKQAGGG
jgi:hypothetical protein